MEKSTLESTTTSTIVWQRLAGIGLTMLAWLCMLASLAHLFVAAMRNQEGELGLGLDATIQGAQGCFVAIGLGMLGIPLWTFAERRLRQEHETYASTAARHLELPPPPIQHASEQGVRP